MVWCAPWFARRTGAGAAAAVAGAGCAVVHWTGDTAPYQAAVKAFQRDNRLRVDGIAGKNTRQALAAKSSQAPAPENALAVPQVTQSPVFQGEEPEATYPYTTATTASVNMRKRASVSSGRILTVPAGASISALESKGDFDHYRKWTGYVMALYVDIPSIPAWQRCRTI